jgi:glycosyltransferase involved in cell wall biosynthesis
MIPKVSVCIPTYNSKDYLREAINSVFAQTYKEYEVVVLDDGSTDGTGEMVKDLHHVIRYFRTEHIGQYPARNKLVELAKGRYVTFLDADDLLFPDALERLYYVIESHGPNVFAYGSHVGINEAGKEIRTRHHKLPSGFITADLFERIHVHSCGTLCHRRLFEEAGGFDTSLNRCAAYKLFLKLSLNHEFIAVEGPVFKRRRHSGNIADRSFIGRKIEFEVLEEFYFKGGGRDVIPHNRAMKRLSQEAYRAGCAADRENLPEQARKYLYLSLRLNLNLKSLAYWIRALI